jgi:hypothetical protein
MNILSFLFLSLLTPTKDDYLAGAWAHYQDTLFITTSNYYYTNADAVTYMCGNHGMVKGNSALVGQCSSGASLVFRNDTLFVITTGEVWTPYMRVSLSDLIPPASKPDTIKTSNSSDWIR